MHDGPTEDYCDMVYAETAAEVETRRKADVNGRAKVGQFGAGALESAALK